MKAVSVLFGLVIFSIFISLLFSLAGDVFDKGKVDDEGVFTSLATTYQDVSESQTQKGSDIRKIADASEAGAASGEDESIFLVKGAVQGGRIIKNSIANFENVAHNVTSTISLGENSNDVYIDSRITNTLIALSVVFFVIISIQFIRGFKLET
jgi:hypothetical protein|tara:strand:- start:331 stop:789 length:459 start_codon:yes stop_codon:yes gene_type:complete